ncbi:MAG: hypothetical protein ABIE74_13145 [Pseudomonadota bacterium]
MGKRRFYVPEIPSSKVKSIVRFVEKASEWLRAYGIELSDDATENSRKSDFVITKLLDDTAREEAIKMGGA